MLLGGLRLDEVGPEAVEEQRGGAGAGGTGGVGI